MSVEKYRNYAVKATNKTEWQKKIIPHFFSIMTLLYEPKKNTDTYRCHHFANI